jgi:hypothetical protein
VDLVVEQADQPLRRGFAAPVHTSVEVGSQGVGQRKARVQDGLDLAGNFRITVVFGSNLQSAAQYRDDN